MPSDTQKHQDLLAALRAASGKRDGSFDDAVTRAFEHVFEHLERLNSEATQGGLKGEERLLNAGESPTLR